jgi:hypothetical protein
LNVERWSEPSYLPTKGNKMDEYAGIITFSVLLASVGVVGIGIAGLLWVLTQIAGDGEKGK